MNKQQKYLKNRAFISEYPLNIRLYGRTRACIQTLFYTTSLDVSHSFEYPHIGKSRFSFINLYAGFSLRMQN